MQVVVTGLVAGGAGVPIGAFEAICLAVVAEVIRAKIVAIVAD